MSETENMQQWNTYCYYMTWGNCMLEKQMSTISGKPVISTLHQYRRINTIHQRALYKRHTLVTWEIHATGYYNVSPNYKLSTSAISKSLLESTRFNQRISMQSGSTTCYSAFISVSQPQSLLLLQPQWKACTCDDCVCASPVFMGYVCDSKRVQACVLEPDS